MSQSRTDSEPGPHNDLVTTIEPGLLRLFRWYVAIRLGILLLLLAAAQDPDPQNPVFAPEAGIVILGLLLAYLYTGSLRERLGSRYLAVAIWVATIGPIVENERLGGEVVGCAFLIELELLGGRSRIAPHHCHSLVKLD